MQHSPKDADDSDDDDDNGDEGINKPEEKMPNEDSPEYFIFIEYDDFLTRFDLDEILSSIDRIIEDELLSRIDPESEYWRGRRPSYSNRYRRVPEFSYIGITAVDRGSMVLTILASGAVAMYVARRFKKGVDKSLLAEELEHAGRLTGDLLGSVLARINNWAKRFVPKQRELGGKVKNVRVVRKRKIDPKPAGGQKAPPRKK